MEIVKTIISSITIHASNWKEEKIITMLQACEKKRRHEIKKNISIILPYPKLQIFKGRTALW